MGLVSWIRTPFQTLLIVVFASLVLAGPAGSAWGQTPAPSSSAQQSAPDNG